MRNIWKQHCYGAEDLENQASTPCGVQPSTEIPIPRVPGSWTDGPRGSLPPPGTPPP
jgi:hypothetical protein